MDIQNDILDYLGSQYTAKMLHSDFGGKTIAQCLALLDAWFPSCNNTALAEKICDYESTRAAASALGKLGGSSTSKRKAAASRRNGKRGGRPCKSATPQKGEK